MHASFSIDAASAGQIAWLAADLGIKATLALFAALVVGSGTRRSSAALRHRVWFLTFCGLLLLPVLPLVVPTWQIPLPPAFDRIKQMVSQTHPTVSHDSHPADSPHQNQPRAQAAINSIVSLPKDDLSRSVDAGTTRDSERRRTSETPIARSPADTTPMLALAATQPTRPRNRSAGFYVGGLMVIWLAGAAIFSFGILASGLRGRQLLRSMEPVFDRRWLEPFEELRADLRVTSRVALLESSQAVVPMATGILRHAVLLPRETEEWPAALRRHVLIHELAHVKRRDVLQHLICGLVTALYWFHPLAWYGMRRMRLEREIACDDCVLMAGEHPCEYAAELVGIARRLRGIVTPWAVCMAGGTTLEGRVRSMLDRARSHHPLSARSARSLLIVALAAISLLAVVEPGNSSVPQPTPAKTDAADVMAQAGGAKQRGDQRLKPTRIQTAEAPKEPETAAIERGQGAPRDVKRPDPTTANTRLRLAGAVLKPNGDPANGATVLVEGFLGEFAGGAGKWTLVAEFSTDARGAFDRDFDGRWRPRESAAVRLSAIMPGYGRSMTVQPWTKDLRSMVLRLADDEPIRARILNLEGRPIAGVRIDAVDVYPSKKEWIDRWLAEIPPNAVFSGIGRPTDEKVIHRKAVDQSAPAFPAASMEMDPLAGLPSAVTDAAGKVEIRGLGRERLVMLKIVGPGIAAAKVFALTHATKTIEFNRGSGPIVREVFSIYGPDFDYIAGPGTVITGVVRDEETKQPIAGAIVASDALDGVSMRSGGALSATTDAEGRYRLDGLSRNRGITVTVTRPDSAYLETDIQVRQPGSLEPIRKDIALRRGAFAVGRAFNIKTGQPVAATLFYTPFRLNEFARKIRRSGTTGFLENSPAGRTTDEGRFRIPILPGRGVIALRCALGDYVPGFGASKSRELSDRKTQIATFDMLSPRWFDAVAEVDLKPDTAELRIDLPVDPGQDVVFKFVDRAGHLLAGAEVEGMSPRRVLRTNTDTITIPATSPDETRIGWIKHKGLQWDQHREGGLCKFLHFKPIPGERERIITLEPPAILTGRLVSEAGEPLRDVSINCSYAVGYNWVGGFPEVRTDAQGRFRYELPGGGPFHVLSRSGSYFDLTRDLSIEPGEQVDFGELVVSAVERFRSKVTAKNPPKRTRLPAADADQKASTSSKKLGG